MNEQDDIYVTRRSEIDEMRRYMTELDLLETFAPEWEDMIEDFSRHVNKLVIRILS